MSPRKRSAKTTSPRKTESLRDYRRKRDFSRTPEPSGDEAKPSSQKAARDGATGGLQFVIQKHAASHLHFDFRLELDGAMKSWAVPKGPSLDPSAKRLAMEVEDHPMEYNSFEGTIPKGEYGGGTVMLWDRGTYTADGADGDPVAALRAGYRKGDLKIWLDGERLRGAWVLRRIKPAAGGGSGERAQWLLIKRHDEFTEPGSDVVATHETSVESGRTMEEIAAGKGKVWRSNKPVRGKKHPEGVARASRVPAEGGRVRPRTVAAAVADALQPMLASIGDAVPKGEGWTFEPKYDGIRVLAYVMPGTPPAVTLVTRNLKDKSKQFPEVVEALARLAAQVRRPIVIDGEIVAVDDDGKPVRFQALQSRMHVIGRDEIAGHATDTPSALYAFDLLLEGDDVLVREPWSARRGRLELLLRNRTTPRLRLAESFPNDGERMVEHARAQGWEGVIAKRMSARYEPGARSRAWLKLKVEWRQEFVVGGWTEPRNSRKHLGALLLGYYDGDRFVYVGHTGGGMDADALRDMAERLAPLERPTSPFAGPVKTNERAHWVDPQVVVEVKFSQWTADGKLRHPIFLGRRDDKDPREVRVEGRSVQSPSDYGLRTSDYGLRTAGSRPREGSRRPSGAHRRKQSAVRSPQSVSEVVLQLEEIQGDGVVTFGHGASLELSNLRKVFFPEDGITKGDLMRYYARMSPFVLPVVADRPLVLKRYPNGIHGKAFYQQRAPDDVPEGVRVETVRNDDGEDQARIIGGDLVTLLWTVQLGAISVDPWLSRVQTCDDADVAVIDLDPGPDALFSRVVAVARWTRSELDELGLRAGIKTSGATGLHVCLPLPPGTSYEAAQTLAQLVASRVAERHPDEATLERSVKARPADAVYVDYLQNIRGKTVAGAYAVRARRGAPVSTPLDWSELTGDLTPEAFTMQTVPARVATAGDLWAKAMRQKNTLATLRRVAEGKPRRRLAGSG
ncbi:MAG: DNA ligase D [Gemmatimonadota bacterium]|nr:DNA ligase D [Gemmatimonadota bacterium]